jgi:hypothetical protein
VAAHGGPWRRETSITSDVGNIVNEATIVHRRRRAVASRNRDASGARQASHTPPRREIVGRDLAGDRSEVRSEARAGHARHRRHVGKLPRPPPLVMEELASHQEGDAEVDLPSGA